MVKTREKIMKEHDHEWGETGFCVHCKVQDPAERAYERSAHWLMRGNELKEKGKIKEAEKAYEKSTNWLMRFNEITGHQYTQ